MEICRSVLLCDHGPHHYWYVFIENTHIHDDFINIYIPSSNQVSSLKILKIFLQCFPLGVHYDVNALKIPISDSFSFYFTKNRSHFELLLEIPFEIRSLNSSNGFTLSFYRLISRLRTFDAEHHKR